MNYLAHAYFSPSKPLLLLGNLSCDIIRPAEKEHLQEGILQGMELHQRIDRYTDSHSGFRRIQECMNSYSLPYAGVLADIVMDHCLASEWSAYSSLSLEEFSINIYGVLRDCIKKELVPGRFGMMAAHLVKENWFVSYSTREGLEMAIERLNYRSSRLIDAAAVMDAFLANEGEIRSSFTLLMKEMMPLFRHSN